ncbi:hypothetical protein VAE063_900151 [Vibrio aestuarianus]|uniref:Uncharacterized protein n=1 Tax=Vibrio aestuarianus TaxID=28171 RepID=A0ABM9FMQ8_9VIBR|nr:hypothetical protein VAE128_440152 [Vibrio aestuarianus]CAH8192207.1 hypothetical protein VAE142_870151 [Vibrio aestuarianus]CAH8200093.1 hypothetical protein VAEKB19_3280152 [Vibrio aestuarianus]CAH8215683.1 hypothetical protein VAE063_900151 [Vibrio aestuarianus]
MVKKMLNTTLRVFNIQQAMNQNYQCYLSYLISYLLSSYLKW